MIFSYRAARGFHHLPTTFQDLSFETAAYKIISLLCCRGVQQYHRPCLFQRRAAGGVKAFLVAGGIYRGFGWYPAEAVIPKLLGTGARDEDLTRHPHGGQIQSAIQCLFLQDLKLHWVAKMKKLFLLGIQVPRCTFSNPQYQCCSRGGSS